MKKERVAMNKINYSGMKSLTERLRPYAAALLVGSLLLAAFGACDIPEFPKPNILKHSRILAIKTDPREVAPGEEVTITGLAVNEDGTIYDGMIAWGVTGSISLNYGETNSMSDLPEGEYYVQMPGAADFTFTIPEGKDFEDKFGSYSSDGVVLTVVMAVGDIENDPIIAFKTVVVKDEPSKENPIFNEIQILKEGKAVEPDEDGIYQVGDSDSLKLKLIADADFPTGDIKTFHWYTHTEGITKFNVEKATEWALPKKAGLYDLYCVARENSFTSFRSGDYEIQSSGVDWKHAVVELK
jgi:hypothetical protein